MLNSQHHTPNTQHQTPNTKVQAPFDQLSDYTTIGGKLGFKEAKTADWSASIAPFWPAVWRTALSWKGVKTIPRRVYTSCIHIPLVLLSFKQMLDGLDL